jgi:hypothetical protein
MFPVLTFLAYALVGWFAPSPLFPDSKAEICSTNMAPVGSIVLLYNDRNRKGATCRVVGAVADKKGQTLNVSEVVRNELGIKNAATLSVYRLVGHLQMCPVPFSKNNCRQPPQACISRVPDTSIVVCF